MLVGICCQDYMESHAILRLIVWFLIVIENIKITHFSVERCNRKSIIRDLNPDQTYTNIGADNFCACNRKLELWKKLTKNANQFNSESETCRFKFSWKSIEFACWLKVEQILKDINCMTRKPINWITTAKSRLVQTAECNLSSHIM